MRPALLRRCAPQCQAKTGPDMACVACDVDHRIEAHVLPLVAMMSGVVDAFAIAARIRSLVEAPRREGVSVVAGRLGISELALRAALDEKAPHPTLDVLAAIVREYGVDPSWLIRGHYDCATHYAALDDEQPVTPSSLFALIAPPDRAAPEDVYEMRVELPVSVEPDVTRKNKRRGSRPERAERFAHDLSATPPIDRRIG